MFRLTLIILSAWVLISCNTNLKTSTDSADSGLADIKMNFTMKSFPWKEGVDATKQKEFFANLSMAFEAPKADKQGANCKEATSKSLKMSPSTDNLSMAGVKLTKKCTYNMKMEISDSKLVYFVTDSSSISQPIPDDGRIKNYRLCLKNAGDLFDPAKAKSCTASTETGGDTDVVITPMFKDGSGATKNADPLTVTIDELPPILSSKTPTDKIKIGTVVQVQGVISDLVVERGVVFLAKTSTNTDQKVTGYFGTLQEGQKSPFDGFKKDDNVILTGEVGEAEYPLSPSSWILRGASVAIKKAQ